MINFLPDIKKYLINLIHFLVVETIGCSLHGFCCGLHVGDEGGEGVVAEELGQVGGLLGEVAGVEGTLYGDFL